MYLFLLSLHSLVRWLVLLSMLYAIGRSLNGIFSKRPYTPADGRSRVMATSISHLQLLIGFTLYMISPLVQYYWSSAREGSADLQLSFFGLVHISAMLLAITLMTIGASIAKRAGTDGKKFSVTAIYFSLALFLILIAILWPFSPLAQRPWGRLF